MFGAPAGDLKSHVKITMKLWMKSLLQLTLSLPSTSCLLIGSALFLPTSQTPTTPFLGSADLVPEVFSTKVSSAAIRLNLDELLVKVGKSKENLDVSYLEANWFLMFRLLKPQTHS